MKISFNGSLMGVGIECGYGYAAVQLINAWQRHNVPVWWGQNHEIAFSFCQPEWYDWQSDTQYKIGYTPWESTKLPSHWLEGMEQMDEIWTTSTACREWFLAAGLTKPVRVLPHGINREHYPLRKRKLSKGEPFKFLHIGEPTPRKGGHMVYQAFKVLYANNPNVTLTLKGSPRFDVELDNVTVIDMPYTQQEMTKLYLDHHAMIYPTFGEGFGLIPFQAAATGMPTAVTAWGGCLDYIHACWPIRVNKMVECDYPPHEGYWAEPSFEDIKYIMEDFVNSPNYFFQKAYLRGTKFNNYHSWDDIAKLSLYWMKEALKNR